MAATRLPLAQELDVYALKVKDGTAPDAWKDAADHLIDAILEDYRAAPGVKPEIVETSSSNFSYLFDVSSERLVAAYGVSRGKHTGKRDSARMRGSPLGGPKGYHRGHAIPHTLGGPLDINLVPQKGEVNIGKFRTLEIQAVDTAGAFYFTYWKYAPNDSQRPIGVFQGLLIPGRPARVTEHAN
jgi:hypothetical protein